MIWAYLALLASLFWAIGNILSKYALFKMNAETVTLAMLITSPFVVLVLGIFFPISFNMMAIVAGLCWYAGYYTFYHGLEDGEVSKAVGVLLTNPIFTAIFSAILLGEILNPVQYLGIGLAAIGTGMLSIEGKLLGKGIPMLVLASILFALSDVASKASLADVDAVSVMFGIRMVGVPLLLLGFGLWRKKIDFISPKLAGFSLTTAVLSDLAAYLFILACTFAYVSLVTAAVTSQAIFAFLGAFLIAKLNPKLLQEDTSRKSLMKKAIALALLIIGVIFVVT